MVHSAVPEEPHVARCIERCPSTIIAGNPVGNCNERPDTRRVTTTKRSKRQETQKGREESMSMKRYLPILEQFRDTVNEEKDEVQPTLIGKQILANTTYSLLHCSEDARDGKREKEALRG